MADNEKYEAPFEDPFDDQVVDDPFVDDHFTGQSYSTGNRTEALPDSTAVLVLGILSILGSFCYGLIGLILGIIALAMAGKPERLYRAEPARYTLSSYNNLKAGKICGIIGLAISILMVLFVVIVFIVAVNDGWR